MSVIKAEHLLVEGGEVCLTVVDTNSQSQSWSGTRDAISSCEVGTRSNRVAEQSGEYVHSP